MDINHEEQQWTSIITSAKGFSFLSLKELREYGFLISSLTKRNLRALYFQTVFGPLWLIIQPLITSLVFIIVFNKIAHISTNGSPIFPFYFSGIVLWSFFSRSVNSLSRTFTSNSHTFSRLYFPRIVVPIADIITYSVQFAVQFVFLLLIYLYYFLCSTGIHFSFFSVPAIILSLFIVILTGSGIGLICSSIAITFRDMNYLVGYGIQMWFYATPILYPSSKIPDYLEFLFFVNPMVTAIELFRYPFSNIFSISIMQFIVNCLISVGLFLVGLFMFLRAEKTCVDRL